MDDLDAARTKNLFQREDFHRMVDTLAPQGSWLGRVHALAGLVYALMAIEKCTSDRDRMIHWTRLHVLLREYRENPSTKSLIRSYLEAIPGFRFPQDELSPSNIVFEQHGYVQTFLCEIATSDIWNLALEKRVLDERHKAVLEPQAAVGAL